MLPRVLPVSRGDKEWYLDAARTGLLFGVANHRRTGSASSRSPVERFGQISPRRHIFIHNGAPQALFDSYPRLFSQPAQTLKVAFGQNIGVPLLFPAGRRNRSQCCCQGITHGVSVAM